RLLSSFDIHTVFHNPPVARSPRARQRLSDPAGRLPPCDQPSSRGSYRSGATGTRCRSASTRDARSPCQGLARRRSSSACLAAAAGDGIPASVTERVLALLAAGGALDDFPASTLRALPAPLRARLGPELATTSLARRDGDGGARALARRRAAVVWIEGERAVG